MNYLKKYTLQGWKNERVVADFQKMGRIVQIKAGDPKLWFKKASRLMEVVDREIGHYGIEVPFENTQVDNFDNFMLF